MKRAYVRVSTVEQNEARQIEGLKKHGIDKWYIEKVSGKNTNREQFQLMLTECESGDTIYVHDFSRFARSTVDLLTIVDQLNKKGVHLVSNKENLDTSTPTGKLMLTMIAAINEFERANMLERQREGIAIAKRNGVYKERCGRKEKPVDPGILMEQVDLLMSNLITKTQMAKNLGVSRPTLNKLLAKETAYVS
jgi:DNA invertase Pin-like site-specific DNA recombinase